MVGDKWLLIGDFNLILEADDKSNSNLNRRLMGEFRNTLNFLELKEFTLKGRKFTWSNDTTQTRIDRAFCSVEWDLMLPASMLLALSSMVSDHRPLLLVGASAVQTYRGFRFWILLAKTGRVSWCRPANLRTTCECFQSLSPATHQAVQNSKSTEKVDQVENWK